MIENERQYRITNAQADKFAAALDKADSQTGVDPKLASIETNALRSQLDELRRQLVRYEELRADAIDGN